MGTHPSVYERVTATIVAELERGVAPWVKPWATGGSASLPYNATTQRRYSGVNVLLLWGETVTQGYRSPAWLTFRQALALGGHVKKGEHATHIVYATSVTKAEEGEGEERQRRVSFLKSYAVFNVEQTEGLPAHLYAPLTHKPLAEAIDEVEVFLRNVGAAVRHGGERASYLPALDTIALPEPGTFESPAHYYATSLHEHAHWTGHDSRLARNLAGRFGTEAYAAEELVAELAAAFLCAVLSIPGTLRHAEYIHSWLALFAHDTRALFTAAARATEAAQFLERGGGLAPEPPTPDAGE